MTTGRRTTSTCSPSRSGLWQATSPSPKDEKDEKSSKRRSHDRGIAWKPRVFTRSSAFSKREPASIHVQRLPPALSNAELRQTVPALSPPASGATSPTHTRPSSPTPSSPSPSLLTPTMRSLALQSSVAYPYLSTRLDAKDRKKVFAMSVRKLMQLSRTTRAWRKASHEAKEDTKALRAQSPDGPAAPPREASMETSGRQCPTDNASESEYSVDPDTDPDFSFNSIPSPALGFLDHGPANDPVRTFTLPVTASGPQPRSRSVPSASHSPGPSPASRPQGSPAAGPCLGPEPDTEPEPCPSVDPNPNANRSPDAGPRVRPEEYSEGDVRLDDLPGPLGPFSDNDSAPPVSHVAGLDPEHDPGQCLASGLQISASLSVNRLRSAVQQDAPDQATSVRQGA